MMSKHFELTNETREIGGVTLHRIRATRDLPHHGVKKGDLGGWVESENNVLDNAWVANEAIVMDDAELYDKAFVGGEAEITGKVRVLGNAKIYDRAVISDNVRIMSNAKISGEAEISGNVLVSGDAEISAMTSISGMAYINDSADISQSHHLMTIFTFGSDDVEVDFFKTKEGHVLRVGCWAGTVDELMDEVHERRRLFWDVPKSVEGAMVAEYEALKRLCEARIARWEAEEK